MKKRSLIHGVCEDVQYTLPKIAAGVHKRLCATGHARLADRMLVQFGKPVRNSRQKKGARR